VRAAAGRVMFGCEPSALRMACGSKTTTGPVQDTLGPSAKSLSGLEGTKIPNFFVWASCTLAEGILRFASYRRRMGNRQALREDVVLPLIISRAKMTRRAAGPSYQRAADFLA
jgi:hypothetical protein